MNGLAHLRKELRAHGVVAAACSDCGFLEDCGGIEPERSLLNCFDLSYCKQTGNRQDCDSCRIVCPYSSVFGKRLQEVGGLRFDSLAEIQQHPVVLPQYIPVIYHGYIRSKPLNWSVVALDTYKVLRLKDGQYRALANDGDDLRRMFRLHPETKILLRGVAKDPPLERYWSYRRRDNVPEQIARLGIALAIGPNFSHFLDVPRTDNLFNRKRQLICLEELFHAGVSAVPHLSAAASGDWGFWHVYLRENCKISYVALEFQTGNKRASEGRKVIDRMAGIRDAIGRPLHPLIIGGAQFLEYVAARFDQFSLIDSEPFMKAVHRKLFDRNAERRPWRDSWTLAGQNIDDIIAQNLVGYEHWINERIAAVRQGGTTRFVPKKPR